MSDDGDDDKLVVLDPGRVVPRSRYDAQPYTPEFGRQICEILGSSDLSIETLCRKHRDWPTSRTLYNWRFHHQAFNEAWVFAEQMRASRFMHQTVEIADDDSRDLLDIGNGKMIPNHAAIARDKLRVETRREAAKRFDPAHFGDRTDHNVRHGLIPLDEAVHQLK